MNTLLLGVLFYLGLAIPLYCLADSDLNLAQIEIARPIMDKFRNGSAGSDYGVYDVYRSIESEINKTYGALIAVGKAFQNDEIANSEKFKEFLTSNRTKLLYWVNYFTASADQSDGTLFRQLLQIPGGKDSDLSRIYEYMVSFYGAEEMAKASEALSYQAKKPQEFNSESNYFGEKTVLVASLSHNMIRQFRLRASESNPIDYGVFWSVHQKLIGNSPYMSLLFDLHKTGRLDIAKVFESSLMNFSFYNLSVLSGYTNQYNVAKETDHPWMRLVLEEVGEDKFLEILKMQMMADKYYGNREDRDLLEQHFISNKIGTLEDGLFRWVTNHGTDTLKAKYYDWVLEMTAKGKDWLKFSDQHSSSLDVRFKNRADDLANVMRKALRQHIANSIRQSNGTYRTALDYMVGKNLLDKNDAEELRRWTNTATAIANEHAASSVKLENSIILKVMSMVGYSERAKQERIRNLWRLANTSENRVTQAKPTNNLNKISVLAKLFDGKFVPVSEEDIAKNEALFDFTKIGSGRKLLMASIFASQEMPRSRIQGQCLQFYK